MYRRKVNMKITIIVLLGSLALGNSLLTKYNGRHEVERLVGGESAEIGEFPYQVSLRRNGQHFCGGSLISKRHVLTAAHCVTSTKKPTFGTLSVVVGTNSITSGGQHYNISDRSTHPEYVDKELADWMYDIGVITLSTEVKLSRFISIVKLPKTDVKVNSEATVTGWGSTKGPVTPIPHTLRKLTVNIISYEDCVDKMPYFARVHQSHVCTFVKRGVGVCNRDSGGPLVQNGVVVGVVSGGVPCARGHPDIFTNVFAYLDYIELAMK